MRIEAIPTELAQRIRREMRDEFGHALHVQAIEEAGSAPCRHCLQMARPGEEMVLFSYQPFARDFGPYSEVGPIFLHVRDCPRYQGENIPPDYANRTLVIRAYDHQHRIHDAVVAPPDAVAATAATFLSDSAVAYVHARHQTYTCYAFRFER